MIAPRWAKKEVTMEKVRFSSMRFHITTIRINESLNSREEVLCRRLRPRDPRVHRLRPRHTSSTLTHFPLDMTSHKT